VEFIRECRSGSLPVSGVIRIRWARYVLPIVTVAVFNALPRARQLERSRVSSSHASRPTHRTAWTDISIVVLCNCHVEWLLRSHMHASVSFEVYCSSGVTHSCHSGRFFYYMQYDDPGFLISFLDDVFALVTGTIPCA